MTDLRTRRRPYGFAQRLLLFASLAFLRGWLFMLLVGVIHHEWIRACPTIGFWWSMLVGLLLPGATTRFGDIWRREDRQ